MGGEKKVWTWLRREADDDGRERTSQHAVTNTQWRRIPRDKAMALTPWNMDHAKAHKAQIYHASPSSTSSTTTTAAVAE